MDERIAQRRARVRRQQRKIRLRRTIVLVSILVFGVAAWAVERSSLVALANVIVEGNVDLTDQEVLAVADLELGTSTLRLDLDGATQRVTDLPAVAEATITRVDAVTVRIEISERIAELRLQTPTRSWLVDEHGVVFAAGEGPATMPVVLLDHEVVLGADAVETGLADAVAVHAGLSGPLRARVTAYRVEGDDVTLLLEDNLVARLGDATQLDEKVRAVGALLAEIEGTDATQIDVRVPSRPVVSH
jgi:cell division protein FtsQ